jgi:hypothetical protein
VQNAMSALPPITTVKADIAVPVWQFGVKQLEIQIGLSGPGRLSQANNFNNLHCQTFLTAPIDAKGIFPNCKTASHDNLPGPTRNLLVAPNNDAKFEGGIR